MECELFVDTTLDEDRIAEIVRHACPGTYEYGLLKSQFVEIYVEKNDKIDTDISRKPGKQFLNFPIAMLLTALPGTSDETFKDITERVMRRLQSEGFTVIAACDFEDELPQSYDIHQ